MMMGVVSTGGAAGRLVDVSCVYACRERPAKQCVCEPGA